MFFLRYVAPPGQTHPERAVLGDAYICCWVDRKTLATADRVARRQIKRKKWEILERDAREKVTEQDYEEGDDWLDFYRQALTDGDVYVFHTSPRYPVFCIVASVKRLKQNRVEIADAHYFVAGNSLVKEDELVGVPNFWNAVRRQLALRAAREAIVNAGWKVTRIVSEQPCGQRDLPEDFHSYYDETEKLGACLVFVRTRDARS
jgi:hypothetical protein